MKLTLQTLTLLLLAAMLLACAESGSDADSQTYAPNETPNQTNDAVTHNAPPATEPATAANDGIDGPLSFTLTNLDGESVRAEDYRGKWLVLNYWATWCAPCRDEMPELVQFQAEHDHVQVLGIAYEDAEVQKLKNFAADFNVNYPLLTLDVYNPPAFAEEGGLGLPTTIVYNPEGMRHKKHMGPIDAKGLVEMLE